MKRINFIQGLSSLIDDECTDECTLHRYGICTDSSYSHCYDYEEYLKNSELIQNKEYEYCMKNIYPLVKDRPLVVKQKQGRIVWE